MRYAPTEVRSRAAVVSRRLRTGAAAAPGTCGAGRTSWDVRYWGKRALAEAAMIAIRRQESAAPEVANERELCRLQERVGFFREPTLSFVRPAAAESRAATHGAATHGAATHGAAAHRAAIHGSATRGPATHGPATHGPAAPGSATRGEQAELAFPEQHLGCVRAFSQRLVFDSPHHASAAEDQLPFCGGPVAISPAK